MNTEKLIFRNTIYSTIGKGLGDLCTFFFLVYFARIFGKDILGKYAFAMSICGFLTLVINFGLNTLVVREISRDKSQNLKYMTNLLVTQGSLAFLVWVLIGLIAVVIPLGNDTRIIIFLIGTYHVFYRLTMLMGSQFWAHEEMKYPAFLETYHKVVILLLGIGSILLWKNAVLTLSIYPVSAISMFVASFWISVSRYGLPNAKIEFYFIKDLFIKAIPFFILILLWEFYDRIGIIFLTLLKGESSAGIYAAGDRLLITIAMGMNTFVGAVFPTMSRIFVKDREESFKLFERTIRLMLVAALPVSTFIFLASHPIVTTLFGETYTESVGVLGIRSWSLLFIGMNLVLWIFLIVNNKLSQLIIIQSFLFVGYGLICMILIPYYGYIGLAYARLAGDVAEFSVTYTYIQRAIHKMPIIRIGAGPVISCSLTVLVFYMMPNWTYWISLPASMIVCMISMFVFKGISIHDVHFVKEFFFTVKSGVTDRHLTNEKVGKEGTDSILPP